MVPYMHMSGVSNGKPGSLPSVDGQQALAKCITTIVRL